MDQQTGITRSDIRGAIVGMTPDDLRRLQEVARSEGRCGSLQTHSGLPCKRFPSVGFTVCRKHGARAPQTIAKAERMLAVARMPAIEALLDIIDQWQEDSCDHCGYPKHGDPEEKRVIMQTAKLVLDRTGMGPRSTLDINANRTDDTESLIEAMTSEEQLELAGLISSVNRLKDRVRARRANVIDVVERVTLCE